MFGIILFFVQVDVRYYWYVLLNNKVVRRVSSTVGWIDRFTVYVFQSDSSPTSPPCLRHCPSVVQTEIREFDGDRFRAKR